MSKGKWWLNGGRGSGRTFRLLWETYENKIAELKRENAELRAKYLQATDEGTSWAHLKSLEWKNKQLEQQIEKMKNYLNCENYGKCGNSMGCPCDKWECIEK